MQRPARNAQLLSGALDASRRGQSRSDYIRIRVEVSRHGHMMSRRGHIVKSEMPTPRHIRSTLPAVTDSALRKQISREVKRALSDAHLSAAAAAKLMGEKKRGKLIYRWINQEVTAPLDNLSEFAAAVKQPLVIRLGPGHKEEAAVDVPRRLDKIERYLRAIARGLPVSAELLAEIEAAHRDVNDAAPGSRPPGAARRKADRRPPGR